ncbi:kelch repeat-containing protein [Lentzea sp. BCCO 10_0061]|uniref:Kelch repeat-containing protein n=1 Tax=Lentzea sokolovensis TaxID=3095429 RepID=A0ABU4V609_9PSEU|nr:kelch repeat-containing protein [Lentzea sp. BCCO 10_0061]MDX8146401.1 kelch repeat-containing protein [Lentzea sp. BCCO 10_0061]
MAEWKNRASLLSPRKASCGAALNGRILVAGGITDDTKPPVASVEARRAAGKGEWQSLPPMPTPRGNPTAAEVDGMMYVVGGINSTGFLDVVERFDPRTREWTTSPALPEQRLQAAAAGLRDLLYVAGGSVPDNGGDRNTDSVIVFNPRKPVLGWKQVAPMLVTRARHGLVAAGGHLYAIGGENQDFDTIPTAERYDPGTNTWTAIAPMLESRAFSGMTVIGHRIAVVGGYTRAAGSSTFLRTTEVYDTHTDRWQTLDAQLPTPKVSLVAAAESNGSLLAIGGATVIDGNEPITADVLALKLEG